MEKYASRNVATNVRRLRREMGWSLAELSERLGLFDHPLSVPVLSKIELGDRGIDVDDLHAFSVVFGVPLARLMSDPVLGPAARAAELIEQWRETLHEKQRLDKRLSARLDSLMAEIHEVVGDDEDVRSALLGHVRENWPVAETYKERHENWPERVLAVLLGDVEMAEAAARGDD